MSEAPKDPLAFDFGIGFKSSLERVRDEEAKRKKLVAQRLSYGIKFLDDAFRAILPNSMVLLGAETGAGKTQTAIRIALKNAADRKHVHYFALEAEQDEVERRIKCGIIGEELANRSRNVIGPNLAAGFNYADWFLGDFDELIKGAKIAEAVHARMEVALPHLHTFYRDRDFNGARMERLLLDIQTETSLIVLDHLHYVDIDDENENRGFKTFVKNMRDVALGIGKPIIVVAHLRKKDARSRMVVPSMDDFHGSSDTGKIVTHAIVLAPAHGFPSADHDVAHTFVRLPKDRLSGALGYIAMLRYRRSTGSFEQKYTVGRQDGDGWKELPSDEVPRRFRDGHEKMPPIKTASSSTPGGALG